MELGMGKKARYYLSAIYKPDENNDKKVKILDRYFIKGNKDKAKIRYKNKICELKEYFEDIDDNYNHKDLIKFKIIFIHNIIDMSHMFYDCYTLISLSDNNEISNIKIYITNSHCMFRGCKSLISLPDISKWNTSNVEDMDFMFDGCNSLISLPDISKWNTSNVNNMSYMFVRCTSLISLPDISNLNLSRVNSMSHMFSGCNSLISLPDLSKWNISNVEDMSNMFYGCNSIKSLPYFYMLNKFQNDVIFEVTYKNNEGKVKILGKNFIEKKKIMVQLYIIILNLN